MELSGDEWARKGATLSDKTARTEFGLTQDEIIAAIRAGKLQYRPAAMHGNPWLRLLRREVEDLVSARHGERYLRERQARAELRQVNRELKQHRLRLPRSRRGGRPSWPNSVSRVSGSRDEGTMDAMTIPDVWSGQDRALTVEDMENMPDDEFRYELDDGVLIVSPAPSPRTGSSSRPATVPS
jgi:hypothetical protein